MFLLISLQSFVLTVSVVHFYDNEIKAEHNCDEDCFDVHHIPFVFVRHNSVVRSSVFDAISCFVMVLTTGVKMSAFPVFDFECQVKYVVIRKCVPLFIKVRSLRN
jgi:hypothetical protein